MVEKILVCSYAFLHFPLFFNVFISFLSSMAE
jgi:hypothetical protein